MDHHSAFALLAETLAKYKQLRFEELEGLVGKSIDERTPGDSGQEFLVEIQVAWVDNRREALRVDASADATSTFRLERIEEHIVVPNRAT